MQTVVGPERQGGVAKGVRDSLAGFWLGAGILSARLFLYLSVRFASVSSARTPDSLRSVIRIACYAVAVLSVEC